MDRKKGNQTMCVAFVAIVLSIVNMFIFFVLPANWLLSYLFRNALTEDLHGIIEEPLKNKSLKVNNIPQN